MCCSLVGEHTEACGDGETTPVQREQEEAEMPNKSW
jgi:hypothetical protein